MNYIQDLRRQVGHAPILVVGASIFTLDQQDRILLLLRVDNGCWGPPGGALEPGEVVEAAAARETLEECGLTVHKPNLYGVFSGEEQFYRYPNGDEVHFVNIVYLCRDFDGAITLSAEHTDWHWFPLDALPESISPPMIPILNQFAAEAQRQALE